MHFVIEINKVNFRFQISLLLLEDQIMHFLVENNKVDQVWTVVPKNNRFYATLSESESLSTFHPYFLALMCC